MKCSMPINPNRLILKLYNCEILGGVSIYSFLPLTNITTSAFIISGPQNLLIGKLYAVLKRRPTDFEALKLRISRSGCSRSIDQTSDLYGFLFFRQKVLHCEYRLSCRLGIAISSMYSEQNSLLG